MIRDYPSTPGPIEPPEDIPILGNDLYPPGVDDPPVPPSDPNGPPSDDEMDNIRPDGEPPVRRQPEE